MIFLKSEIPSFFSKTPTFFQRDYFADFFNNIKKKRFQSWAIKFWILAFDQVPLDLSTDYHYVWNKRFLNSFIFLLDYFLNSFDSESSNFRDVFEWVHLISVQKWPETSFLKIPNISKNQTFIKFVSLRFSILLLKSSFRTFPHPNAAPWRTIRGYNQSLVTRPLNRFGFDFLNVQIFEWVHIAIQPGRIWQFLKHWRKNQLLVKQILGFLRLIWNFYSGWF